jgi:hypothetical protein
MINIDYINKYTDSILTKHENSKKQRIFYVIPKKAQGFLNTSINIGFCVLSFQVLIFLITTSILTTASLEGAINLIREYLKKIIN